MRTGEVLEMDQPSSPSVPAAVPLGGAAALVGRSDILDRGARHVTRATERTGGVLVVRGEAGVGKSCVISELVASAERAGATVLFARAEEFEEGIPYAVYRAALTPGAGRSIITSARGAQLVDLMSGDLGNHQAATDGSRLARVHTEFLDLVQDAVHANPLMVVVEDLHVADPDSATLTRVLARSASALGHLVVVSLRPDVTATARDMDAVFERMAETGEAEIVEIPRLDDEAVAELVELSVGAPPDNATVAYIVSQTHGNPFFVKELLLGMQQADALAVVDGECRLTSDRPAPIGRRTAILHRVFSGARSGREVAKAVAVLGRVHPTRMPLVADLARVGTDGVEESFDRLVREAILRPSPDGGYEFTHPLVRSALYDDIGPAERRRLHAAAAQWLSARGDSRDRLEATAHVAESATSGDAAAVDLLIRSADATATVAPMNAAAWYGRALDIMDPEDDARFTVRSRQARALWMAGRPVDAGREGRLALAGLPDGERARTAILTVNALYAAGEAVHALEVCEMVLEPSGERPAEDHPTLRAQRLHIARQVGIDRGSEPLPDMPSVVAKPGVVRLTHLLLHADLVGDVPTRRTVLEVARETLPLLSPGPRLALLEAMAMVHADAGELSDASAVMHEARRLAEGTGASNLGGQFASARVRFHRLSGDWDAALETAVSAAHELAEAQQIGNLCIVQALTALILVDQGRFDEADRLLVSSVAPVPSFDHLLAVARARRLRVAGDPEGAVRVAADIELEARAHGWEQWRYLLVQELVEGYLETGRLPEAAEVVATLDPADARPLHRVVRLRLAAAIARDVEGAVAVRDLASSERLPVEAAISSIVAARLGADEVDLQAALAVFEALHADPWAYQTRQLMREKGEVPPRVLNETSGALTATELKMARLVQQGLTNREIAGALHYSPKTVEVYLSRVYAKVGVASRLALARAMDGGALG